MKKVIFRRVSILIVLLLFIGASNSVISYKYNDSNDILDYFKEKLCTKSFDSLSSDQEFDMVIIAPSEFSGELEKLVNHKNNVGVKTKLITVEDICSSYSGVDKAEQIKYSIKDAIENLNISYVLLVGGLKKFFDCDPNNEDNWYVPARYSYLDLDGFPEPKYLCDLYFADVYWNNTNNYCDWNDDINGDNSKFGEWRWEGGKEIKDGRDLIPDVAVGRLPCRNNFEVKIMVDKIIKYESSNHTNDKWFLRMLLLGGDSYDDSDSGEPSEMEGNNANQMAYDWCKQRYSFEAVKLWPSSSSSTKLTVRNFIHEQNKGSGLTFISGHGDCGTWFNHQYYTGFQDWTYIQSLHLLLLRNRQKLPVVVIGGCHTASFDKDLGEGGVYYTIECFSWMYTRKILGGSIATVGNTAIEHGIGGTYFTEIYGGYLETRFFEIYGSGTDIIGDIWKEEITNYVNEFDAEDDLLHCKAVENWVLLGDPSLKIGGY